MTPTAIAWSDETWNPITGCSRVSPGCVNCYAERLSARLATNPATSRYQGVASFESGAPRWSGALEFHGAALNAPLKWTQPRMVFTCSMSDLFHEKVSLDWILKVFAIMALSQARGPNAHVFQVLTKRPEVMRLALGLSGFADGVRLRAQTVAGWLKEGHKYAREAAVVSDDRLWRWPLPNVWLGTSAENQKYAHRRIPSLLLSPAEVHFLSYEPALGPVNLTTYLPGNGPDALGLDWVIAGGESGPGHREADVEWYDSVYDQCIEHGVSFFMKQDSGSRPGKQGRIRDDLWRVKQYPVLGYGGLPHE